MRIEKCVEDNGKRITVYVDDDTVRATDHEAVRDLIHVLSDVTTRQGDREMSGKAVIVWHSVDESLPEDDERVLIATPMLVLIGTKKGMTRDAKYWSRLPSVP